VFGLVAQLIPSNSIVFHPLQQHVHPGEIVGLYIVFVPEDLAEAVKPQALSNIEKQ